MILHQDNPDMTSNSMNKYAFRSESKFKSMFKVARLKLDDANATDVGGDET